MKLWGILALALLPGLSLACGGGGAGTPAEPEPAAEVKRESEPTALEPAFGPFAALEATLEPAHLQRILDHPEVSDHVREVLADGVLTFAEYEASILGYGACVKELGGDWKAGHPKLNVRGIYSFAVVGPYVEPGPGDRERSLEHFMAILKCQTEALGPSTSIDAIWKQLVWPTEQELQAAMREFSGCLEKGGLGYLADASRGYEEYQRLGTQVLGSDMGLQAIWLGCANEVSDRWGLVGFGAR